MSRARLTRIWITADQAEISIHLRLARLLLYQPASLDERKLRGLTKLALLPRSLRGAGFRRGDPH